jgi:hypothetical protein
LQYWELQVITIIIYTLFSCILFIWILEYFLNYRKTRN